MINQFLELLNNPIVLGLIEKEVEIVIRHNPHIFATEPGKAVTCVIAAATTAVQAHLESEKANNG